MLWTRCVHSCIIVIIIVGGRLDYDYDNDDDDNDWAGPGCCVVKSLIVQLAALSAGLTLRSSPTAEENQLKKKGSRWTWIVL